MPLDIGIGLLLGVLFRQQFSLAYPLVLALGVVASLLPDIDYVYRLLRSKKAPDSSHRDTLHYPLVFIPFVSACGLIYSPAAGLLFCIGAMCHFIHDSVGIGFGVKWLFPFNNNSYALYHIHLPANEDMPRKKLYTWNDTERRETMRKYRDPQWIRHVYFQFHPYGIMEYSVLLAGIAVAILFR